MSCHWPGSLPLAPGLGNNGMHACTLRKHVDHAIGGGHNAAAVSPPPSAREQHPQFHTVSDTAQRGCTWDPSNDLLMKVSRAMYYM